MPKPVLIINGPNLNRLGAREPDIYGTETLETLNSWIAARAGELGLSAEFFQSNHEGELIDRIHAAAETAGGIILNPGGYTHTSVSLRDAVASVSIPVIEVHISNIFARESFRRHSVISGACRAVVSGLGTQGYLLALEYLAAEIR